MARALRLEFEDAIYHITARGNRRERIFSSDADRTRFLEIAVRSLARFEVELQTRSSQATLALASGGKSCSR